MSGLDNLADVCRRTGFPVVEVDGWQGRGRGGSGGHSTYGYLPGAPNHVIVHHTASGPSMDGWPDVNYCTFNDDAAPLCNLYLARDGTIYVCAGMATNTNGSGHDPCGWIADDTMNSNAVGIEAGNSGTGERWPNMQLDSYTALCAELCDAYGIPTGRIHSHAEYAPSRKVDPAGPDRYAPGNASWDMTAFRADCADTTPAPIPPPIRPPVPPLDLEEDDMALLTRFTPDNSIWVVATDFSWKYPIDQATHDSIKATGLYKVAAVDPATLQSVPSVPPPYDWI